MGFKLDGSSRLGLAGLVVAFFAIAAFYIWPDKKFIGWGSLAVAAILLLVWGALEMQQRRRKRDGTGEVPKEPFREFPSWLADPHRPRLVFDFTMKEGFTIRHVGGDAAIDIRIGQIQSVRHQLLSVVFEKISVLDSTDNFRVLPFRYDMGDRVQPNWTPIQLRNIFFKREDPHTAIIHYPVTVSFLWLSKRTEDHYTLTWDRERSLISVAPENHAA
jgi:hypothetical protein